MKKVALIVLLAIVASTLLMAAVPTKMVRLTMINKSGYDVFVKLTGSAVTDAFYYLTSPSGDTDVPSIKVFTVMSDLYDRETWQCNGVRSTGTLVVTGNIRLTFPPCGQMREICRYESFLGTDADGVDWYFKWSDPCQRAQPGMELSEPIEFINPATGLPVTYTVYAEGAPVVDGKVLGTAHRNAGEPTQEKVTYFRYLAYGDPDWTSAYLYNGFWATGCATFFWRSRTWRTPVGCEWRYQY